MVILSSMIMYKTKLLSWCKCERILDIYKWMDGNLFYVLSNYTVISVSEGVIGIIFLYFKMFISYIMVIWCW